MTLIAVVCSPLRAQPQFVPEVLPGGWTYWEYDGDMVVAGDVDRDGDVDLVWSEDVSVRELVVYINDGRGAFRRETNRFPGLSVVFLNPILLRDLDNDGDLDVLLYPDLGGVQHWQNDGRGFFANATASTLPPTRNQVGSNYKAIDFDGDGSLDVFFESTIWRNLGNGVFREQSASLFNHTEFLAEAADVNGDGRPDILVSRVSSAAAVDVYANQGAWQFSYLSSVPWFFSLPNPEALELADIDNDGDKDLLVVAVLYSRIWKNDGTGRFVDSPTSLVPPVTYSAAARFVDFDEDGDLDLWMGNGQVNPQRDQLYVNDGSGTFTDETLLRVAQQAMATVSLATADVDGDGDVDVIAAHAGLLPAMGVQYRNKLRDVGFAGSVRIGNPATMSLSARRGFASASQLAIAALTTRPLVGPIVLPPFGAWRLDPAGLIMLPPISVPAPSGEVSFGVPVPGRQDLVGQTVSVQALIAHDPAPSSWRFTSVARAPITR